MKLPRKLVRSRILGYWLLALLCIWVVILLLAEVKRERPDDGIKKVPGVAGNYVGFFHMFAFDVGLLNDVISEQIKALKTSGVLANVASIQYAYFGPNHESFTVPTDSPKYIKSNISNKEGTEISTLAILHDHCLQNIHDTVFYIHSKGSFSPHAENTLLRQNLMKSIIFCLNHTDILDDNDICGFKFSPIPYPQFTGARFCKTPPLLRV